MGEIYWANKSTREDFSTVLWELLFNAEKASQSDSASQLQEVADALGQFIDKCEMSYKDLYKLARQAQKALLEKDINKKIKEINASNDKLMELSGDIVDIAKKNTKRAEALSLAALTEVLVKTKSAIEAAKTAQEKLEAPDASLQDKLKALGEALKEVYEAVTKKEKEEKKGEKG